ncbi:hypothetical protein OIN60_14470 [Paenibacillus sp. P96]|uniref:Uncharacterized protein n=1 Tax=Paenibacillus zeirhizosphaerae TaxID=2987519 RepID=A0ABT9FTA9_9BACL|nr:hypothetical protein [Paenibacillus sp. P96]MDP4097963.1 hypothetical protein [Paenibacillus sp. P96]
MLEQDYINEKLLQYRQARRTREYGLTGEPALSEAAPHQLFPAKRTSWVLSVLALAGLRKNA